jgi:hypothetical protein
MVVFSLILLSTFALANTSNINVPAGDENSYKGTLNYSKSTVSFVYDAVQHSTLSGLIFASGMKQNFTYQVKLLGKPTCKYGSAGNDTLNEYIGYHGRWTCASCNDSSVEKNRNDAEYAANKAKSDLDLTKECIQAYLVFDFFTTNASGYAQKSVLSDSSYRVLFCNGGSCGSTSNAYLVNGLCSAGNVEGQIEPGRGSCGSLTLKPGNYNVILVLTEESFHQGAWASVLQGDIDFRIIDSEQQPIPEFGTIAAMLALCGAATAFFAVRKK